MAGTDLAAGGFSAWLEDMQRALQGVRDADVPCGTCTACCESFQFVHVGPHEVDALAHIPAELLFPAPRMPTGHVLLGYDERGRCPMLTDDGCSIYEHRPRTCRTYDCRVFPAAGVEPDGDQALIARQARRWRFDFPTEVDRVEHEALQAAAASLAPDTGTQDAGTQDAGTPDAGTPDAGTPDAGTPDAGTPTQRAVRAIEVHAQTR